MVYKFDDGDYRSIDTVQGETNLAALKKFGAELTKPLPKTTGEYGAENLQRVKDVGAALAGAGTSVADAAIKAISKAFSSEAQPVHPAAATVHQPTAPAAKGYQFNNGA